MCFFSKGHGERIGEVSPIKCYIIWILSSQYSFGKQHSLGLVINSFAPWFILTTLLLDRRWRDVVEVEEEALIVAVHPFTTQTVMMSDRRSPIKFEMKASPNPARS